MSLDDIKQAVTEKTLSVPVAEKYLRLYVADIDWAPHIASLWKNATNKFSDQNEAKAYVKKAISCAILLPMIDKIQIPDPPHNLLFWCTGWKQFNSHDWFELLLSTLKDDILISENRNKILSIGIIDPVDMSPMTRQAFNWLYDKTKEELSPYEISEELNSKLTNLVRAYGGAIICNIFMHHKLNIDKVLNWRSGYFFEKQIYKVYDIEQILKIKSLELNKTNKRYVKQIGVNHE